MLVININN